MYRLYNIGIERKIDWLVKNGKLKNKKILISPWNNDSINMYNYMTQRYGVYEIFIIDDEISKYNNKVLEQRALENFQLDKSYVALLLFNDTVFSEKLEDKGIPCENIYIIKGDPLRAQDALIKCGSDNSIRTVLDVGCGKGDHSNIFLEFGKQVTGIDAEVNCKIKVNSSFQFIQDDFIKHEFMEQYDLVWCSHVLEHQLAVGEFIEKLFSCCKDIGKVAITVPNEKQGMVMEGHVNNWNAGLLMYNIIQSGFNCRNAAVKTYAGNVSVIVTKEKINKENGYRVVGNTRRYFPANMKCGENRFGGVFFDGNIEELNWD